MTTTDDNDRPAPPPGGRNLVVVVLDSLRYDSWIAARAADPRALGAVERRWSYASWTAPSHYNLLMGLLPHTSPAHVYASEYYKEDFLRYSERLGVEGIEFSELLPSIFLPTYLRDTLGYRTAALVSMPVLNPHTAINRDFDSYELMPTHNDMAAMLDEDGVRRRPAVLLPAQRRRDALPVRAARRGPERVAADLGRPRRLQAPRRRAEPRRPSRASSSTRTRMRELHDRQIRAVELPRRRVRAALRPGAPEHLDHRHLRPRRAVRRGRATSATARSCTRRSSRCPSSRASSPRAGLPADRMDAELERRTLAAEDGHWWYRGPALDRPRLGASIAFGGRRPPILDAGCGGGAMLAELARPRRRPGSSPRRRAARGRSPGAPMSRRRRPRRAAVCGRRIRARHCARRARAPR